MMRLLMKNPKDIYETELKTDEVISEYQATSSGGAGGNSKSRRVSKSATSDLEKSDDKHHEDTSASGDNIEDNTGTDTKRTNKQRRSSSGAQNGITKTRSKMSSAESRENISGDEADEVVVVQGVPYG